MTAPALSATPARATSRGRRGGLKRVGVFALGSVLNLLGAAAWLLSVLLMAPLMLAGLWVWSHEFDWAERMLTRFRGWTHKLWCRARAHPVRWGVTTVVSIGATTTAYWLLMG